MKLTENTLNVLQSFSGISNSMLINAGNKIRVISPKDDIVAYADVDTTFPIDFGIYDMSNFLSVLSLVAEPDLDFGSDYIVVKDTTDNKTSFRYGYADNTYLKEAPKEMRFPKNADNIEFTLTDSNLQKIVKAASAFGSDFIAFSSVKGSTDVVLSTHSGSTTVAKNEFSTTIGTTDADVAFEFIFDTDCFRLIKQDYNVTCNPEGVAQFIGVSAEYFIVMQETSSFSK